jgi:hypothetical protein
LGLNKESAHYLDITAGGSFTHKIAVEGRKILDRIIENASFVRETNPLHDEAEMSYGEALDAKSKPSSSILQDSTPEPSP